MKALTHDLSILGDFQLDLKSVAVKFLLFKPNGIAKLLYFGDIPYFDNEPLNEPDR